MKKLLIGITGMSLLIFALIGVGALTDSQTSAQSDSAQQAVESYLAIPSTGDVSLADEIMAEDYEPLYASLDVLPGRDAFKDRAIEYTEAREVYETSVFHLKTLASIGDETLFLGEWESSLPGGETHITPFMGMVQLEDGIIVAGYIVIDEAAYMDSLTISEYEYLMEVEE